jgi:putative ABC transport system permease protein
MKYLFKLAYANIAKARLRTILTLLIISVALAVYVFFDGCVAGFKAANLENVIGFDTGHFKIRSGSYDDDAPYAISNFIANYDEVYSTLDNKPYVEGYTERIIFLAEIDNGWDSLPLLVYGINRETDGAVFTLKDFISEGELVEGGALIGNNLARDLEFEVGDFAFITFRDAGGMFTSIEVEISGIINSADPVANSSSLFIDIEDAKVALNTDGVSEITVITDNAFRIERYGNDLAEALPAFQIIDWQVEGASSFARGEAQQSMINFIFFFLVLVGMVGIANTMLMSVYEKKREIGMLKALGMTEKEIRTIFVLEGLIIGVSGAFFGVILGIALNSYFVINGMDFTAILESLEGKDIGYRIMGVVYAKWNVPSIIGGFVFCIIVSILASFYPAKKAASLEPMECLRINQ